MTAYAARPPQAAWDQAVSDLVEAFTYENCEECGQDAGGHVIGPDMFGHPHAWCLVEA
jgi:hypothetical protein